MIHKNAPEGFNPKFEVTSCFFEHQGEILLLHRQDHKPEGNTWGVPAGKVDNLETHLDATVRELFEETGNEVDPSNLKFSTTVYVRYPDYDFTYHIYHLPITGKRPEVKISPSEHKGYSWASPEKALKMPLIQDLDNCIKLHYNLN